MYYSTVILNIVLYLYDIYSEFTNCKDGNLAIYRQDEDRSAFPKFGTLEKLWYSRHNRL